MDSFIYKRPVGESLFLNLVTGSRYRLLRHLLFIAVIAIVLFNSGPEVAAPALTLALFLLLFYLNMYLLVPKLLFRNRYALYVLSVAGVVALSLKVYLAGRYFFDSFEEGDEINIPLFIALVIVLLLASSSIKFFQKWIADRQLIYEMEKSKISAELEQLKNQINPHFLFNMLNSANVLTKKDPDKASQVLMRLSDLLRYQLYDSTREKVLLTSDIRFLRDFLNLEKVRRDNFDFFISMEGDLDGVQVPPLLFISIVENAVKHNNDAAKASYVHVYFSVENRELLFRCINSKPELKAVSQSSGLGLANIRRRLELLFPVSHKLDIKDEKDTYTAILTIQL